jgi:ATP-dependent RNA helicase DeaD
MSDSTDDLNPRADSTDVMTESVGGVATDSEAADEIFLAEVAVPDAPDCAANAREHQQVAVVTSVAEDPIVKDPIVEETVAEPQPAKPARPIPVEIASHVEPDEVYLEPRAGYDEPIKNEDGSGRSEPNFAQLNLSEPLLQSVLKAGYSQPTPIQGQTIPLLLEGRDVIGQAQTGTGKTAAFALPMLELVDLKQKKPQILVLTPTRELAIQVAEAFEKYASHMKGLRVMPIYGGQDYTIQFRQLERGVHVIVATPGRVMDHMRRGTLNLDDLRGLVLDEADEMLRMGFAEDVEWVLSQSPNNRQIALFSATMPAPIRKIAKTHLNDPATVTIQQRVATADTVRQRYVIAAPHQKQMALGRILEGEPTDGVLVFVKMKSTTEPLAEYLAANGHKTAALNGDIPQKRRERTIEQMREGKIDVIVATDVAARGLDVQRISHVVNYDLPHDTESYVHRIGRTGRAGRSGEAILFVHPREQRMLKRLERETGQPVEPMDLPSNRAINKQRVARFHERITEGLTHHELETFEAIIEHYRRENDVPLEHIAAALAVLANGDQPLLANESLKPTTFGPDKQNGRKGKRQEPDKSSFRSTRAPRRPDGSEQGMQTYRIEVGSLHDVKPGNIVGAIANEADMDSSSIGRIEIFADYSTVDLPESMPEATVKTLQRVSVAGQQLNLSRMGGSRTRSNSSRPAATPKRTQTHSSRRTLKKMAGKPKRRKESTG